MAFSIRRVGIGGREILFNLIVEAIHEIPGRGILASGVATLGHLPRAGSLVVVHAPGREPVKAIVRGVEMGNIPPRLGLHLGGVSEADVPIGSRIEPA